MSVSGPTGGGFIPPEKKGKKTDDTKTVSSSSFSQNPSLAPLVEGLAKTAKIGVESVKQQQERGLDDRFIVDNETYKKYELEFNHFQFNISKKFNIGLFFIGSKASPSKENEEILTQAKSKVRKFKEELGSYEKVIGLIEQFEKNNPRLSTFALRTAILLASHEDGDNLESWTVYTKRGKPKDRNQLWGFIEDPKNWIPEAQGSIAKHLEASFIKARELAKKHPENQIVLLKGSFGAGKTRQTKQLYGEELAEGVIAPDKSKDVVRRGMPSIPHSAAHIHGSQVAYALFDDIIKNVFGTVVYDSSLSNPADLAAYLEKSRNTPSGTVKKLVVYDVARYDMARILSVLARSVDGEDPRIPPEQAINGALYDKLRRHECMNIIRHDKLPLQPELAVETPDLPSGMNPESLDSNPAYYFIGGDEKGWNTEEVLCIRPKRCQPFLDLSEEAKKRLKLEGIVYNKEKDVFDSLYTEESLKEYYNKEIAKTVKEVLNGLSEDEKRSREPLFGKVKVLSLLDKDFNGLEGLYKNLDPKVQGSITEGSFIDAFKDLPEKVVSQFIENAKGKDSISYLDFPIRAALAFNAALQSSPWIE